MSATLEPSIKATLRQGAPPPQSAASGSVTGTLVGLSPSTNAPVTPVDLGETVDAGDPGVPSVGAPSTAHGLGVSATTAVRTTVLPRRGASGPTVSEERQRFERVRVLGEGGMGFVELARDNDIRRTVAVKRMHGEAATAEALMRFADEVRIVGQLEHPAIVPVYDVGRDESGHVYLVMKHLNGETMEAIIEKLRASDPAYVDRFSTEYRIHLFLSVLDAIRYAHARGVIHRDIKPANIMVGPFGEVTVLDWGIAKPMRQTAPASTDVQPLERTLVDTHDKRLQQTQLGALAGTPLYMSPEQAAGRNDELDQRSDVYSLCVLLYEWLSLEHPLSGKKTVTEVLSAIISGEGASRKVMEKALRAGVPAEWVRLVMKGLTRDPELRFQSAAGLEDAVKGVLDGRVLIECHLTLAKRTLHGVLHWIDRHPALFTLLFFATALSMLGGLAFGAYRLLHG
jgi:eukaryotic-like serine/threonine-protein kinase